MNLPQKISSRLHPVLWLMATKSQIPGKLQIALPTCFFSIVQKYIPSKENAILDLTNLRNFVKSNIQPLDMFSIPIMSEDQVLKFLGDLDETKITEMNGVSAKLFKIFAPVLAKPLTNILNLNLTKFLNSMYMIPCTIS